MGIPDEFIEQGKVDQLQEIAGIGVSDIVKALEFELNQTELIK